MGDAGWIARVGRDTPEIAASKLRSIRRLVLLMLACEGWIALRFVPYSSRPGTYGLVAAAFGLCAIVGWRDRFARAACAFAGALLLGVVVSVFPENANHQYLALIVLALILLADSKGAEAEADAILALQLLRWIALVGIVWAGVMKLWYGYWLEGEFLAYRLANDPGFARVLGPLVPDAELERLLSLGTEVGAGPYRPAAPLLVAVSNLTWVAEIVLPLGLLSSRTRVPAMLATIGLFLAIEAGAREIIFGGLMTGLLLLFAQRDRVAQALPWIAAVYLLWLLQPELTGWLSEGSPQ
jgi:hypothetical protein